MASRVDRPRPPAAASRGAALCGGASLVFLASLVCAPPPSWGQTAGKPEAPGSENAPPAPADPSGDELVLTLRRAKAELEALKKEVAREQGEILEKIADENRELGKLHDQEAALLKKQREVGGEIEKLDADFLEADTARKRTSQAAESAEGEVESQALAMRERLTGSLTAVQRPGLLKKLSDVTERKEAPLVDRLRLLLEAFEETLDEAATVSSFRMPLALSGTSGTIDDVTVLRVGLLPGGYYAHPASSEAGFIISDSQEGGGKAGFRGLITGLTGAQRLEIAAFVENPRQSGFLPADVTGGQGLATLQSARTVAQWFEVGGIFMWPLLLVALASVLLTVERTISLSLLSLGIQRRIRRVLSRIEDGRLDEAEAMCRKMRGATGAVLSAALVHRHEDRSVMEDAVQEALLHQAPKFQARLPFIALCAAVAPLIGLLGTVTGMILTFKMVTLFGTSDPRFMAGGISEALITTEGGLYVAIPSLLVRGVLGSVADRAVGKLETGAMSVVLGLLRARGEAEAPLEVGAAHE